MNKSKMLIGAAVAILVAAVTTAASAATVKIVALGDSLTAGYGVGPGDSFPEQLEAALKARGHDVSVVNAGVSGDTASDGLARLDWSVPADADIVIVELGANDALRGIAPEVTRNALTTIVSTLVARGQAVFLAGMLAPPNMGSAYSREFNAIYPALAKEYSLPFDVFFLAGVATDATLNQPDGMHPNAEGVAVIVKRLLPEIEALVTAAAAGG
jgi:acyl-CoA thioesterase-1